MRLIILVAALALGAQAVRDDKFYRILGVSSDADDRTIKKAYKKQAL
jgi:preprotein translocase subunit Sec63